MGLPLHPLVVHFAVVLIPLAFVALLAVIAVERLRQRYALVAVAITIAATLCAALTHEAGEQLATLLGAAPSGHVFWGNLMMGTSIAMSTLALVWYLLHRMQKEATATLIVGWVSVAAAGLTLVFTILAGHSGAESVWGARLANATDTDMPASTQSSTNSFTMADVMSHNTPENCYTVIDTTVYNLTDWISAHPGGAAGIEKLCGTDGTAAFSRVHGSSEQAQKTLEKFAIGRLAQ